MCLAIVEAHDGFIAVDSESGVGSAFTACLPVAWSVDADDLDASPLPSGHARASVTLAHTLPLLRGLRVVLAEDNSVCRRMMKRLFVNMGAAEVLTAVDGREVQAVVHARADLSVVFMDMVMPVCDGMSATRALRAAGCTLPIIALTGNATDEQRDAFLAAAAGGPAAFMTKPVQLTQLRDALESVGLATPT